MKSTFQHTASVYKHITIAYDLHDYDQIVSNQMQSELTAIEDIRTCDCSSGVK